MGVMLKLLVVESPTKAKTIGKDLGNGYEVVATVGHLRDLPKKTMGVDAAKDFEIEYVIDPEKKKVVAELLKKAKTVEKIFLATDPDREGEAISWHVWWILGKGKDIKRVSFHEITKGAVEAAIEKPREIDM